jgi:Protein of unknown function (DUF3891)
VVLRPDGEGVVAIGQPAHAWLSGQLARAWGNDAVPAPEPLEEVCLAAEQHDVGMAEWDLEPTLNAETGLPHSFMEMPLGVHLELWSAAAGKLARQSTYAALLVSMHGTALYEMRDLDRMEREDADAVRRFLAARRDEQDRLLDALGLERESVLPNQRLIWTWDYMSLALCLDWPPAEGPGVALEPAGAMRVAVDPWPFGGPSLTVRCEGRRLAGGYSSEAELHAALADAPLTALSWELVPGAGSPSPI